MLASTTDRVPRHTASDVNQRIQQQIEENVRYFSAHPHQIATRLNELDHEWDIERTLEANAATVGLTGVLLGAFVDRKLLVLPAAVMAFLLQHCKAGVLRCHFSEAAAFVLHTKSIKSDMLSKRCAATSRRRLTGLLHPVGRRRLLQRREKRSKQSRQ